MVLRSIAKELLRIDIIHHVQGEHIDVKRFFRCGCPELQVLVQITRGVVDFMSIERDSCLRIVSHAVAESSFPRAHMHFQSMNSVLSIVNEIVDREQIGKAAGR